MQGLNDLIASFTGETTNALNSGEKPWQQELLETVNPAKQKRRNIARALAQASTTLAQTPGDFLTGLSAAAATGADAYITGRDQDEEQRTKVQQLIQMATQKDQDRRLNLIMDAIGVQRNIASDQREAAQDEYTKSKDEREWNLRKKESDARTEYYNRRGRGVAPGSLTTSQILTTKRAIRQELRTLENQLRENAQFDETMDESSITNALINRQSELEDYYGINLDDPDPVDTAPRQNAPQVPAAGTPPAPGTPPVVPSNGSGTPPAPPTADQNTTILPPQPGAPEATKTVNGKTYVKINGTWYEQQ